MFKRERKWEKDRELKRDILILKKREKFILFEKKFLRNRERES